MKVGVLVNTVTGGGAERQAAQWAAVIARWPDADVEMLTVLPAGHSYAVPEDVRLTSVGKRHRADLLRVARGIRRFARRMDIAICFQPYPAIFCVGLPVPVLLVTGDDPRVHWDASGVPNRLIDAAFRNAVAVSAPAPELVALYQRLGIAKRGTWLCIPNIVDGAGYATTEGISKDGALFVGRLEEQKDPLLAVDVCAAAAAPLTVLGEGPLRDQVAARAAGGDVQLRGFVSHPWEIYARHRVLVLTSRNEAFGNVIVESLAAGTPVLSVDCDFGPRYILSGTRYSTVVESRDPVRLGSALRAILDRPYSPEEAAECAEIAARYHPDAVEPLIRDAIDRTLAGSRS
jgi:glycosyltransferase involved in cell wall biosynthesis